MGVCQFGRDVLSINRALKLFLKMRSSVIVKHSDEPGRLRSGSLSGAVINDAFDRLDEARE
jgi:hypothetical protein